MDHQVHSFLNFLNQAQESGRCDSLQTITSKLKELEDIAAAREPYMLATVTECRVLVTKSAEHFQFLSDQLQKEKKDPNPSTVIKWHLAHLNAKLLADYGQELDDDNSLHASIDLLKTEILPIAEEIENAQIQVVSLTTLGNVLGMMGQRRRGTRYFEDAISAFSEALKKLDPETTPLQWASLQNSLGNALGSLGQRSSDDALLQKSIEAFEQALTQQSEQVCPQDWASTMNNQAAVLQTLGRKRSDTKILKRSVESYKAVLRVWTRKEAPLDWATTMDNLGTALRSLGEHRRGPGTLKQAVAAYNSALGERYREEVPNEWAMTHNNLGAALQKLAEREDNPDAMLRATESYEQALSEWTREKVPMTWAMTMANLGVARREFAQMTGSIESAGKAVEEIQSAVDIFRSASHAQYTELGEEQLSKARRLLEVLVAESDQESVDSKESSHDD